MVTAGRHLRPARCSFRSLLSLVVAVLAISLSCRGDAAAEQAVAASSLEARLQAVLNRVVLDEPHVPGILLSVSGPSATQQWSGAAGKIRRDDARASLRADQPFRIASVTKVFVAASLFRLTEQGRLGLFAPIAPLLSSQSAAMLQQGGYDPSHITVQQLLAHTSGLYDYASDESFLAVVQNTPRKRWTRSEQIELAITQGKPLGKPGERYAYSDTGYILLGEIIERSTGRPLPTAVRTLLNFKALGLASTYFESLEAPPPAALPIAHQYLGAIDTVLVDPSFDLYGGGGLVSTTADLNRFFRALIAGRVFKHRATLASALMTIDAQHDPGDHLHANLLTTWRFGQRICWGHRGFWGTQSIYCPDIDTAVSFTVNQAQTSNPDLLNVIADTVAEELTQQQQPPAVAPAN